MPTDDEIRAEMAAIIAGGEAESTGSSATITEANRQYSTPPAATTTAAAAQAAQAATAAAAGKVAEPPAAPALDEQTSRKLAVARRAQQDAQRERQQAAAERQQLAAEVAEAKAYRDAVARAKATGDIAGLARAHGIDLSRSHATSILAETLGKDAPAELRTEAQIAQLERRMQAQDAELARRDQAAQQAAQEAAQRQDLEQRHRAARDYVRAELLPELGDKTATIRALAAHPEFGDGVVMQGISHFQQLAAQRGDAEPAEAFQQVHSKLIRMAVAIMSDPAAAAEIQKAVQANKPQPPVPAEKTKPAPTTISNQQHFSSTTPPAPAATFEEQAVNARAELKAMRERGEI